MKFTRRELAAGLTLTSAALAQTAVPVGPVDELQAAQSRFKASAAALARHELPIDTEPAFQFKA